MKQGSTLRAGLHLSPSRPHALAALREMAHALSAAWDLDTTLDLIVRKTTEVMHVDSCSIYLLDSLHSGSVGREGQPPPDLPAPDGRSAATLRLRATTGLAPDTLGRATLQIGEGMTGHAVAQNRPVFARNAQDNPHFKWVPGTAESSFHSLLAVPLVVEEQPLGALNVQTIAPHDFTPEEVEVVSLIADLAAGTLARAQLHDTQKRQIEELQALAAVSEVVTSPQYLDDILNVVTSMAARLLDAALCSIFLLDEAGGTLELRAAQGAGDDYRQRPPQPAESGIIGLVARDNRPVYVPDVRSEPSYRAQEMARREGLVSLLSVPLSVRDRVIGVFNCYSSSRRAFSAEQEALLLTLANQTALAIEHARLATNAALVREVHHRIKNNLQAVAMLLQLQLAETEDPGARHVLDSSMQRVHTIAAVHEVLSAQGFHLVDLKAVLERAARMVGPSLTAPHRQHTITVDGAALLLPTRVATNLALVVNELIQNALEHAFADRDHGHVIVTLAETADVILLSVSDDGAGLPPDHRPGLGTEIVTTLVHEELRGEIQYRRLATGTEVTVRLPREAAQRLWD
jgi:signal transduction protein with GAF and PtsI domain